MGESLVQPSKAALRVFKLRGERGLGIGEAHGQNPVSRLSLLREEDLVKCRDAGFACALRCPAKRGFDSLVRLGCRIEVRESLDRSVDHIVAHHRSEVCDQRFLGLIANAEKLPESESLRIRPIGAAVMIGGHLSKLLALGHDGLDHLADIVARGESQDCRKS